jgi:hypothetical protein
MESDTISNKALIIYLLPFMNKKFFETWFQNNKIKYKDTKIIEKDFVPGNKIFRK